MNTLSKELMMALATLDARIPRLGLYAIDEYRPALRGWNHYWKTEWDIALLPRLKRLGCEDLRPPNFGGRKGVGCFQKPINSVSFIAPNGKKCELQLVRVSTVKVRKYGSGFHVDRKVAHFDRWAQLKMEMRVRGLWWPSREGATMDIRMILFLGFDKANRPFRQELTELEEATHWKDRLVGFNSISWPDAYGRDFNTLLACWSSEVGGLIR